MGSNWDERFLTLLVLDDKAFVSDDVVEMSDIWYWIEFELLIVSISLNYGCYNRHPNPNLEFRHWRNWTSSPWTECVRGVFPTH
jgi:hypothetical protein